MRDRIAVIGQNGTGKTTLFEILSGNVEPDSGNISMRKDITIGYLHQDIKPSSKRKLLDEVAKSSASINNLAHKIDVLQTELAEEKDDENKEALLAELGELQHSFEFNDGYNTEQEARVILSGLGFVESDFSRSLAEFSGGWLMRVELAKLLFLTPDLLMLDEPTNHLDLETINWFENYLKTYQGAVLVTSHDRAFLTNMVNKVIAIEKDEVVLFNGNYESYIISRERELEIKQATAKRQELKIQKEMRFIERFRAKNTKATQVQSRINKLEKMEKIVVPRSTRNIKFSFPEPPRSGKAVISLENLSKSYDDNVVYNDLNLVLNRGDKAALVGPNGAGKTTLLKLMAGVLPFEQGERIMGHNVSSSYFAQYYIELLNPENIIIDELRQIAPDEAEQKLRGLLGAFLFSGDDVFKRVSVLSGGEKTRLAVAKMLTKPANLLLMDEPTNHLDIPSREILTDALEGYNGTMCFITHDRTLIRQIANKIIEIRDGIVQVFDGNYDAYLYRKEILAKGLPENLPVISGKATTGGSVKNRQRQRKIIEGNLRNKYYQQITPVRKRIAEIENEVVKLTERIAEIEKMFSDPEHYKDGPRVVKTNQEYREAKNTVKSLSGEWDSLTAEAERLTQEFEEARNNLED